MHGRIAGAARAVRAYDDPVKRAAVWAKIPAVDLANRAMIAMTRPMTDASHCSASCPASVEGTRATKRRPEQPGQGGAAQTGTFRYCLLKELLRWFKHDFFKWVNEAPCDECGGPTSRLGGAQPTEEERRFGAGITEVFRCKGKDGRPPCQGVTRFPRINDPAKLLETRRGR